jgi:hypothetical protein
VRRREDVRPPMPDPTTIADFGREVAVKEVCVWVKEMEDGGV